MARKRGKYKRAFFTGLATLLPTILTIYILTFCYSFVKEKIAEPINGGIEVLLSTDVAKQRYWQGLWNLQTWELDEALDSPAAQAAGRPDDVLFSARVARHVPWWLGLTIAILLVYGVGFLLRGYLGRQLVRGAERGILRLPVIKVIYPYAKQVTEFFFEEKKQISYESAVAVEYPRRGVYSLGFITNSAMRDVSTHTGQEMVSVFIPSSPTPITGYTIQVSRDDLLRLDITVDEAIRFTISGGVILPPDQLPPLALKTKRMERPAADLGPLPSREAAPPDPGSDS